MPQKRKKEIITYMDIVPKTVSKSNGPFTFQLKTLGHAIQRASTYPLPKPPPKPSPAKPITDKPASAFSKWLEDNQQAIEQELMAQGLAWLQSKSIELDCSVYPHALELSPFGKTSKTTSLGNIGVANNNTATYRASLSHSTDGVPFLSIIFLGGSEKYHDNWNSKGIVSELWQDYKRTGDFQKTEPKPPPPSKPKPEQSQSKPELKLSEVAKRFNQLSVTGTSRYLEKKNLTDVPGSVHKYGRDNRNGNYIAVPYRDACGRLVAFQKIADSGGKRFETGTKHKAAFCALGLPLDDSSHQIVYMCEGYADGLTIVQALEAIGTPAPVLVVGSAGNFENVVQAVNHASAKQPLFIIARDNDKAGIDSAAKVIKRFSPKGKRRPAPVICVAPSHGMKDFNDLLIKYGMEAVIQSLQNSGHIIRTLPAKQRHDKHRFEFLDFDFGALALNPESSYIEIAEAEEKLRSAVRRVGFSDEQVVVIRAAAGLGKSHQMALQAISVVESHVETVQKRMSLSTLIQDRHKMINPKVLDSEVKGKRRQKVVQKVVTAKAIIDRNGSELPHNFKSLHLHRVNVEYQVPGSCLIFEPTVAKAHEIKDIIVTHAPALNDKVVVYQGMGRNDYVTGKPMCQRYDEIAPAANIGIRDLSEKFCRNFDTGEICQHYNDCLYIKQKAAIYGHTNGDTGCSVLIHSHSMVQDDSEMQAVTSRFTHTFIDESFIQHLINVRTIKDFRLDAPLDANTKALIDGLVERHQSNGFKIAVKNLIKEDKEVMRSLDLDTWHVFIDELVDNLKTGQAGSISKEDLTAALELLPAYEAPDITPSMTATGIALETIKHALRSKYSRARALVRHLLKRQSITYESTATGDEMLKLYGMRQISYPRLVIIDASADDELIQRFTAAPVSTVDIQVRRNTYVRQIHSTEVSDKYLTDPRFNGFERYLKVVRNCQSKYERVVVCCNLKVKRWAVEQGHITREEANTWLHFGNLRGIDKFKFYDCMVIIGRPQPPDAAIHEMARAVFGSDTDPLPKSPNDDSIIDSTEWRVYEMANGSLELAGVSCYKDSRLNRLLNQSREQELIQAVDRLRAVRSEKQLNIYLCSNIPLTGLEVNELVDIDESTGELVNNQQIILTPKSEKIFKRFLAPESTGILPLSADLYTHGELGLNTCFSSENDLKQWSHEFGKVIASNRTYSVHYNQSEACLYIESYIELTNFGANQGNTRLPGVFTYFRLVNYRIDSKQFGGSPRVAIIRGDITEKDFISYMESLGMTVTETTVDLSSPLNKVVTTEQQPNAPAPAVALDREEPEPNAPTSEPKPPPEIAQIVQDILQKVKADSRNVSSLHTPMTFYPVPVLMRTPIVNYMESVGVKVYGSPKRASVPDTHVILIFEKKPSKPESVRPKLTEKELFERLSRYHISKDDIEPADYYGDDDDNDFGRWYAEVGQYEYEYETHSV